jgi:effector-binding domain-containing protein
MKILKYIFLLLLLIAIGLVVFIATQDGKYDIRKERVINVPRTTLYNYINDYRNWENVGILTNNDTTAAFGYTDVTSGSGAKTTWKLNGSQGEVKTLKAIANDSLIQKAIIDGQPSDIAWGFRDVAGGTKVSVRMKGELSFSDKAYAVLKGGVKEKLEATLDAGLESLNNFLVVELKTFKVNVGGQVTKTGTYYLKQNVISSIDEVGRKTSEMLSKLMQFVKTNNIVTNGAPFTMYKTFDTAANRAEYAVCIPIKEEIFTMAGSEYEGGKLEPFQAMKITLKGDYSHLKKAWDAGYREINLKGIQLNTTGAAIEVYTKGVQQTKRPSQWVTDIYIPVGPPTAPPAAEETIPMPPVSATGVPATSGIQAKPAATTGTKPAGTATPSRATGTTTKTAGTASGTATQPRTTGTTQPRQSGTTTRTTSTPANKPAGTTTTKPATTPAQPARTVPTQVTE